MPKRNVKSASPQRWLLLLPQLPAKPDYLRVKLLRRLQRLGAIALKYGVHALPYTDQSLEDSEWLRRELADEQADLLVCSASLISGLTDGELVARFRSASDEGYASIAESARRALADGQPEARSSELVRAHRAMAASDRVDFFGSEGRDDAERAVKALDESIRERVQSAPNAHVVMVQPGRTWVTRKGVFVDRIASAWLIRRFIDPKPKFKFVNGSRGYRPASGEIRFDMYSAEFTHQGDRCTFEALLAAFGLDDPALVVIGEIVHDIDCQDDKYHRPEVLGLNAMLTGIQQTEARDSRRLTMGGAMFDGLYAQLSRRKRSQ